MSTLQKLKKLQKAVENRIATLKITSQEKFGVAPDMQINYDLESINTLGLANYYKKNMRLNKYLLLEFGEKYIDEVVVHEYAHFVVHARKDNGDYGIYFRPKPHGKEFKEICREFGIVGKSTTNAFSNSEYLRAERGNKNSNKKIFYSGCDCKIPHELSTINTIKLGEELHILVEIALKG